MTLNIKNYVMTLLPRIKKRITLELILIVVAMIVYNYFWDLMAGSKILAFNSPVSATVWDMGAFYGRLWASIHSLTFRNFVFNSFPAPIVLIMSPLSIIHNPFFFVYLQTFWISAAAIPIYFISIKKIRSKFSSLLIAISYLVFFGIAGLNWFDIHYQTLFIPLFLLGVALYYYKYNKLSTLILILAGSTHFLFMIFPVLFYSIEIISTRFFQRTTKRTSSFYVSFLVSLILFFLTYASDFYILGSSGVQDSAHIVTGLGLNGILNSLSNNFLNSKMETFFIFFTPFLMLPLISKRWFIFTLYFLAQVFVFGSSVFLFPSILMLTEQTMLIPFLYLGTIDSMSTIGARNVYLAKPDKNLNDNNQIIYGNQTRIDLRSIRKYSVIIFLLIILMGTIYEPYGPLNEKSGADFNLSAIHNSNMTFYTEYMAMVKLLPTNSPKVLYQNNMPAVLYRDPSALTSLVLGFPNNYSYPVDTSIGPPIWVKNIKYIITDPYSYYFTNTGTGVDSLSMYDTVQHFLNDRNYGVEAEYDGLLLVSYRYSGLPVIYGPLNLDFSPYELYIPSYSSGLNSSYLANGTIYGKDLNQGVTMWYGPYTFLQPGLYNLTLTMKASNISADNSFQVRYSWVNDTSKKVEVLNLLNITGRNFKSANKWVNITLPIRADNFYQEVEFAGRDLHWNGVLQLKEITVRQIAPPSN